MSYYGSFVNAIEFTREKLKRSGRYVEVEKWQGVEVKGKPDMVTYELLNHSFSCLINPDINKLKEQIKPNLPWADDHFLERVGGVGLNPGEQYKNWPYYVRQKENDRHRDEKGRFTHTYMERFWPNNTQGYPLALMMADEVHNGKIPGIRYEYGDLLDLINLLLREPHTRQAFLPIWYPEDTGAVHGGRVPCTLGYHFMMRENHLHIWYPIRACDFIRHFRDDIYLACRLLLWVLDMLRQKDPDVWDGVHPGQLHMHIYSLHVFRAEVHMLERGNNV